MKRLTYLLLTSVLVLSVILTACGNNSVSSGNNEAKVPDNMIDVSEYLKLDLTHVDSVLDTYINLDIILDEYYLSDKINSGASDLESLGYNLLDYADVTYSINDGEALTATIMPITVKERSSTDVIRLTVTYRDDEPSVHKRENIEGQYNVKFFTEPRTVEISLADAFSESNIEVRQPIYIDMFEKFEEMGALSTIMSENGNLYKILEPSKLENFDYEGFTFKRDKAGTMPTGIYDVYMGNEKLGMFATYFYVEGSTEQLSKNHSASIDDGGTTIGFISTDIYDGAKYHEEETRIRMGNSDLVLQPIQKEFTVSKEEAE